MPFALVVAMSIAAAGPNPHLAKAIDRLNAADAKGALGSLNEALAWPGNSSKELATVYLYIGLARASLDEEPAALESFTTALELQPALELPGQVSPKVQSLWEKAGGRAAAPSPSDLKQAPVVVTKPETSRPEPPKPSPPLWPRITGGITLAAGAIATGIAVPFGLAAQQANARSLADASATARRMDFESAVSSGQMANRFFAIGGGLLLIGAALFVASFFL